MRVRISRSAASLGSSGVARGQVMVDFISGFGEPVRRIIPARLYTENHYRFALVFFLTPLTTAGGVEKCIDGRQNYSV